MTPGAAKSLTRSAEYRSSTTWEKLKTFEDAKKLVASSAGIEFEKYPLKTQD